eukprot:SAG31_NODE_2019_length_6660_cov_2.597775_8_plen_129_part_00
MSTDGGSGGEQRLQNLARQVLPRPCTVNASQPLPSGDLGGRSQPVAESLPESDGPQPVKDKSTAATAPFPLFGAFATFVQRSGNDLVWRGLLITPPVRVSCSSNHIHIPGRTCSGRMVWVRRTGSGNR